MRRQTWPERMRKLLAESSRAALALDFTKQPRPGKAPMPARRALGNAEGLRGLVVGHAGEESKLDELGGVRVLPGQLRQRFINGQQRIVIGRRRDFEILEIHPRRACAAFERELLSCAVNEDAPHRLCRRRKEMPAALELRTLRPDQPEPCLMDQRRGLECLAGGFVSHFVSGEPSQFLIDQRKQLLGSFGVPIADRVQDARYIVHGWARSDYTRVKAVPMRSGSPWKSRK